MQETTFNRNRHNEYSRKCGSANIVIFVHGILGSPGQFRFLAEALSKDYDFEALLLPGHGGSGKDFYRTPAKRWPAYVTQRVNQAVKEYQKVYLVGHSLGGLISLECAACANIAGIVLINTPLAFKISLKQLSFSAKIMLSAGEREDEFLSTYRDCFGVSDARLYEYPLWLRQFAGLLRYIRLSRKRLKDITARALIVQSFRDESVHRKSIAMMKTGLNNASTEIIELEESYHGYFPERDKQILIQAIKRFLAGQQAPSA